MAGQSTLHPDIQSLWRRKSLSDALMGAAVTGAGYKGLAWGAKKLGLIEDTPDWLDWSLPAIAGAGVLGYNTFSAAKKKAFIDTFNKLTGPGRNDVANVTKATLRTENPAALEDSFPIDKGVGKYIFPRSLIPTHVGTGELRSFGLTLPSAILGSYYAHNMDFNPTLGFLAGGLAGGIGNIGWNKAQMPIYDRHFKNPMADEAAALKYLNEIGGTPNGVFNQVV